MVTAPSPAAPRERRGTVTAEQIKAVALDQLAAHGAEGLALRAVAREVGVSVQALYHYFASRDALVTALVADAFTDLARAVRAALHPGQAPRDRVVAAGLAYRAWAVQHRSAFLLTFGSSLPDDSAPEQGPTTAAARTMKDAFEEAVFGGWSAAELAVLPTPDGAPAAAGDPAGEAAAGLPPGALALFVDGWAGLHGVVVLELLGHLHWTGTDGEQMCRDVLLRYTDRLTALRATTAGR